jgi:Transposase
LAFQETSISKHFGALTDPRVEGRTQHSLLDVLTIVLCGVIGGAEGFNDIELFAECKESFFRTFLELRGGIPSHDTMNRVMSLLSPQEFGRCFTEWVQSLSSALKGVVAIDGKTLRRSFDNAGRKNCLHMVSAWASETGLVLGQLSTDEKSNEITAIPKLLSILDLKGSIVTIDAMGCQVAVAQNILDSGGDYVLALKGNQGDSLESVKHLFAWEKKNGFQGVSCTQHLSEEKDHGRMETRRVISIGALEDIDSLCLGKWPGLLSVTMVESTREIRDMATTECRYYISSLPANAKTIGQAIRSHWGIENSLHWVLDVVFHEDDARNRKDHSAENMAIVRHIALNMIKMNTSKGSLKGKRKKAGWDNSFLIKIIADV